MQKRRSRWLTMTTAAGALACSAACASDDEHEPAGSRYVPGGSPFNGELPVLRCPGDEGCRPTSDPTLYAGAATEDITPKVDFVVVESPQGEVGKFEPNLKEKCVERASCDFTSPDSCPSVGQENCTWIAGSYPGRPATDVAAPTEVGCTVLRQGETTIGLCAIDCVLWLYDETVTTRELLAATHPELDVDFLLVSATHLHQTQDTVGFFGPSIAKTGRKPEYNALIREKIVLAVARAHAALEPVTVQFGAIRVDGSLAGTDPSGLEAAAFVSDTRDPVVIDDELRVIRFKAVSSGVTVSTVVNWTAHAEYGGLSNTLIHPDYPGALREAIETGIDERDDSGGSLYRAEGIGGETVFFPGAVGGQVGPGVVEHVGFEGKPIPESIERAEVQGKLLAAYALKALEQGSTTIETPLLGVRAQEIFVRVENKQLLFGFQLGLFELTAYHYDDSIAPGQDNYPYLKSEVGVIDIGPAEILVVPGEVHAELMLATREGASALDAPYPFTPPPYSVLNDPAHNPSCGADGHSRCNTPAPAIEAMDRSRVIDLARDPTADFRFIFGLSQGHNGYVVPEYDFEVHPVAPYFQEPDQGNHYEETVSFGPNVEFEVLSPLRELLKSNPVIRR